MSIPSRFLLHSAKLVGRALAIAVFITVAMGIHLVSAATSINTIVTDTSTAYVSGYSSVVLDQNGYPVIIYNDALNDDLKLVHCNDTACAGGDESIQIIDGSERAMYGGSLLLDNNGYPVISYFDYTLRGLRLAHCNDANCDPAVNGPESIAVITSAAGQFEYLGTASSLRLDQSGYPVISFTSQYGELMLAHCTDRNCSGSKSIVTVHQADLRSGRTSLALDANGNPVIALVTVNLNPGELVLVHCNDPKCSAGVNGDEALQVVDTGISSVSADLALVSNGFPVISYTTSSFPYSLKLAHCNDGNCDPAVNGGESIQTVTTVYQTGGYTSLVLDTSGNPVIATTEGDGYFPGSPLLVHCNDVQCAGDDEQPQVIESYAGVGTNGALALDSAGMAVISYLYQYGGGTSDAGPAQLRLAHCDDILCTGHYMLNTYVERSGSGTVLDAANGVNCVRDGTGDHTECNTTNVSNTVYHLVAIPGAHSTFDGFVGLNPRCDTVTTTNIPNDTCNIRPIQALERVEVSFSPKNYVLTVNTTGPGSGGTYSQSPAYLNCQWDGSTQSGTCHPSNPYGTQYHIVATANPGSAMGSWAGCDSVSTTTSTGDTCVISPGSDASVSMSFTQLSYMATLNGTGTGQGIMMDAANSINCTWNGIGTSGSCTHNAPGATNYAIVAAASSGSTFGGWTGCGATTTTNVANDTCRFSGYSNMNVTARFNSNSGGNSLAVSASGTGAGVMLAPQPSGGSNGISCT